VRRRRCRFRCCGCCCSCACAWGSCRQDSDALYCLQCSAAGAAAAAASSSARIPLLTPSLRACGRRSFAAVTTAPPALVTRARPLLLTSLRPPSLTPLPLSSPPPPPPPLLQLLSPPSPSLQLSGPGEMPAAAMAALSSSCIDRPCVTTAVLLVSVCRLCSAASRHGRTCARCRRSAWVALRSISSCDTQIVCA
jgi:hypothetical protein